MPTSIREGGDWKEVQEIYVSDDETQRRVFSGHIKVNGVWKVFHLHQYEDDAIIDFAMNRAWPNS